MVTSVSLGARPDGREFRLTEDDLSTHVHVCGASGRGKSKLLEAMIQDHILARQGVCLIDPHGTLYDAIVAWIAMHSLHRERAIHLIDPSIDTWTTGINPLEMRGKRDVAARVHSVVEAFAQVWGGEDTTRTPRLRRVLGAVLHVLIVNGLTLLEAIELITATDPEDVRASLTENVQDYLYRQLWTDFNGLQKAHFLEQFESTTNRFIEFLGSPTLRSIIGTTTSPIDLRACMDEGGVVLVKLQRGSVSYDTARVIGTLITSELFAYAIERDTSTACDRPFYLYLDECSRFLTNDIVRMLDETRKYGLHCCLSHQRLGQLRHESESLYNAIMAGAQTKIFFGCEEDEDAEIMSRHLFRTEFDLERPVESLIKPVAVDQVPLWLQAEGYGFAHASGAGSSQATNYGRTAGVAQRYDESGSALGGIVESSGKTEGGANAETVFDSGSSSYNWSRHEALRTVFEDMPTQNWTIERWIHEGIVRLRQLAPRHAIVKAPAQEAVEVRTPFIRDPIASAETVANTTQAVLERSRYAVPRQAVDQELKDRHARLRSNVQHSQRQDDGLPVYDETTF